MRKLEGNASLVVLPASGLEIEIRDGNFTPMSRREIEQRRTLNGVVPDFHGVTVFEYQHGWRQRRVGVYCGRIGLSLLGGMCGIRLFP